MLSASTTPACNLSYSAKKIAAGLQFTEGPAWHPNGFLLFSDLPANKIYRLFPQSGEIDIFINDSGFIGSDTSLLSKMIGSNGIAIDNKKNTIFCQHGNHALACLNTNNELQFLTCLYEGKPYNSPNDLAIKSDGSIYFTDPPYGLKDEKLNEKQFQPCAGVYRFRSGHVELLSADLTKPNGLCFSPGEKYLYVSDSDHEHPAIHRFRLSGDGRVTGSDVFLEELSDGMCCDEEGNLFLTSKNGIQIFSPEREKLNVIGIPGTPSNIVRAPGNIFYVTAGDSIYVLESMNK